MEINGETWGTPQVSTGWRPQKVNIGNDIWSEVIEEKEEVEARRLVPRSLQESWEGS